MNSIPDHELDLLCNTVDLAISYATQGQLAGGLDELGYGVDRAAAIAETWGEPLLDRWRLAVDNYCQSYGVPLE